MSSYGKGIAESVKRAQLEIDLMEELETDPEFANTILAIVMQGLDRYRAAITKKNAQIDLIVRNLKPEYYANLKKYVIPEIFENLGLADAIKVIEKSDAN